MEILIRHSVLGFGRMAFGVRDWEIAVFRIWKFRVFGFGMRVSGLAFGEFWAFPGRKFPCGTSFSGLGSWLWGFVGAQICEGPLHS